MNLLAHGTTPSSPLAVHLEIGLKVEALYVLAVMASGRKYNPFESDWTLQRDLDGCLLYSVPLRAVNRSIGLRHRIKITFDLGNAVFRREESLPQQPLQDRPHAGSMNELQDKQVRAAAGSHSDLDGVSAGLTNILDVKRLV